MWTNLDVDPNFPDHPKVLALEDRVGAAAITYLIRLWCWAARFATSGILKNDRCGIDRLEQNVMRWTGKPGELCEALIEIGFIHRKHGHIEIHGFAARQAHLDQIKERAQKAARARWDKARLRDA